MKLEVVFSPEAQEQLAELYRYIAEAASPAVAAQYTEAIVSSCESLCAFPLRGVARDDVRTGLRITHHKGRAVIAYAVDPHNVSILGIFYGGQDYAASLQHQVSPSSLDAVWDNDEDASYDKL